MAPRRWFTEMAASTALIERYRFDRCFDVLAAGRPASGPAPAPAPAAAEPGFTRQDIEHARAEGFARGRAEAADAEAQRRTAEQQRLRTLELLAGEVRALRDGAAAAAEAATADAVLVANAIVRKLMPRSWREGGAGEIAGMVRHALAGLTGSPAITVRIAPELHPTLQADLLAVAAECGAGDLRIVADRAIAAGDCRIDWPGGGVLRDQQALWREIDRITEAALGTAVLAERQPEAGQTGDER